MKSSFARSSLSVIIVAAQLAVLLFNSHLGAQVTTADIVGTVTDASSAVLPGAKITVENLDTRAVRNTLSGSTGDYVFTLLPIGRYSVKAEATGFGSWSVAQVSLAVGDRLRLDVHMEVGQVGQSVEVTARTPALQSDSSSIGTLVNERAVQDLPLNGRNFVRLATLGAGANEGTTNGLATGNRPDDRRRNSSFQVN